jgi:hypothetical protein
VRQVFGRLHSSIDFEAESHCIPADRRFGSAQKTAAPCRGQSLGTPLVRASMMPSPHTSGVRVVAYRPVIAYANRIASNVSHVSRQPCSALASSHIPRHASSRMGSTGANGTADPVPDMMHVAPWFSLGAPQIVFPWFCRLCCEKEEIVAPSHS